MPRRHSVNFFTSRHYYFFEKLKILEKQLCSKLNSSYGKVSHTLLNKKFFFISIRTLNTGGSVFIEFIEILIECRTFEKKCYETVVKNLLCIYSYFSLIFLIFLILYFYRLH